MRVAILSDIHGNAHALGRCLDDLASRGGADVVVAAWVREQIGEEWTQWLGDLPFTLTFGGQDGLLVCHANPRTDDEHVWPDADDATLEHFFAEVEQQAVAFGHLHLSYVRLWRGKLLVNVASAGLPKDGDSKAHYAILTQRAFGWEVQQRRVEFDVEKVARQLVNSGMPDVEKRVQTLRRARYPKLGKTGSLIP
jgi:predicted phosphodiesterase